MTKRSKGPKMGEMVKVHGVRMPDGTITQVNFKETADGKFRAKPRGYPCVFVRLTEKGAKARIRGEDWIETRSAEKAFAAAVKTQIGGGSKKSKRNARARARA